MKTEINVSVSQINAPEQYVSLEAVLFYPFSIQVDDRVHLLDGEADVSVEKIIHDVFNETRSIWLEGIKTRRDPHLVVENLRNKGFVVISDYSRTPSAPIRRRGM